MSRDPAARCGSALDLARDVERWLDDEPVPVWREPWPRRLGRWTRRHRTAVAALGAIALTTLLALAVGLVIVGRKESEAQGQRLRAQAITAFLVEKLLGQASPERKRRAEAVAVEDLLDRAARGVGPDFAKQPDVEADLRHMIGSAYLSLGKPTKAEPHLRRALAVWCARPWSAAGAPGGSTRCSSATRPTSSG